MLAAKVVLPPQPHARAQVQQTTIGSITAIDPYRWMEDMGAREFEDWVAGQAAYTRAVLDRIGVRRDVLRRLAELAATRDEVRDVRLRARQRFYLKRPATEDTFKLYVRDGANGAERVLVDPHAVIAGTSASIDYYEPSPNGQLVAFGASASGSEDSVIHVVDVASGKLLPDTIDRARQGEPRWRPDGASFFYRRNRKLGPDAPAATKYQGARSYLHLLGRDPERDPALFGFEVSPRAPVAASDYPYLYTWPGCRYVFALAAHGTANDLTLYYAPLDAVDGARTPWIRLVDVDDQVLDYAVHGDDLYLVTHRDAPRGQVVRTRLSAPDVRHAEVLLAPRREVAVELAAGSDGVYVKLLDGGVMRVMRVAYDGSAPRALRLPFDGTVTNFAANPTEPGFWCQLQSWTRPRRYYAYDPSSDRVADLGVDGAETGPLPAIESRELRARSADGTMVPLSIVYARGTDLTRPHPTLLSGYGNYGMPISAGFDPRRLAWLERGGIYAVAHVRGGGEYGEPWHRAGMKQHKQNSVDDFVACARTLIELGYTAPRALAAEGTSAGGLTIGGAVTQHPELFGAVLIRVGITDALRFETTPIGPANTREFGSTANPDEVAPLFAMSPYYHVVDGARYPAVLLTGAAHDARVPLWQPGKMAARLQAATSSDKPILLRVERGAGHGYGFGSTNSQVNEELADCYAFLWWQLGGDTTQRAR